MEIKNNRIQLLNKFFHLYADRFNNAITSESPDIEGTAKSFSDCFIAASPLGVACGTNNEEFKTAMLQGYSFYKSIGVKAMDIVLVDTTILDDFHEMTKIVWKCSYLKKDHSQGSIEFANFYFTRTKKDEHKIFAYITEDEQAALKEIGLI